LRGAELLSNIPLSRLSFKWQITLLGALSVILFLAVLVATFSALRYAKSSVLIDEKRYLSDEAIALAREYADSAQPAPQNELNPPLDFALGPWGGNVTLLTRSVLRTADGVEGGFYSPMENTLVGYSFPTRYGTRDSPGAVDLPANAEPAILQVAHEAALIHKPSEQVLTRVNEIILIEAVPVRRGNIYVGSAWTMMRLSSLPGSNRFRAYLIAVGLGISALFCVVLTLLVVRNLQSGVMKIESGLENLETNLSSQIPTSGDPDEIRQIARAINRLGTTLKENLEREKEIEDRLRHAERLAALGRLVAGVAHEVRNPLSTIRLRIQMCERGMDNANIRESCAVALEEIERLNGMVNRLLSFSRPVHLRKELVNLSHLVRQRLDSFQEKAQRARVKFVTNFTRDGKPTQVDQNRMAQVFDNVIQNAIDAMSESGGALRVSVASEMNASETAWQTCVEFRDAGKGITTDTLHRIFDPFFTTKPAGTGLGLSICHELVRAHGGEIHVESVEGQGTVVHIRVPAQVEEVDYNPPARITAT
jgi:signal transduction histidine kinase